MLVYRIKISRGKAEAGKKTLTIEPNNNISQ